MSIFDKLGDYYGETFLEKQKKISRHISDIASGILSIAIGVFVPVSIVFSSFINNPSEKKIFEKLNNIGISSADSVALNMIKKDSSLINKLNRVEDLAYFLKLKGDTSSFKVEGDKLGKNSVELKKIYEYKFDKKPGISYLSKDSIGSDSEFLSDSTLFSKNMQQIYVLDDKDKEIEVLEANVKDVLKTGNSLYFLRGDSLIAKSKNLEKTVVKDIKKGILQKINGADLGMLFSKNYQLVLNDVEDKSENEDYQRIDFALNHMGKSKKKYLFNSSPNLLFKDKIMFISKDQNIYAFSKDSLLNNKDRTYMNFLDAGGYKTFDYKTNLLENGDIELISLRNRDFNGKNSKKVCVFYNEKKRFDLVVDGKYNKLSEIPNLNKIISLKKK